MTAATVRTRLTAVATRLRAGRDRSSAPASIAAELQPPPARAAPGRTAYAPVTAFRISDRIGLEVSIGRRSFGQVVRFAGVTNAPTGEPTRLPRPLVIPAYLLPQLERAIACARAALLQTNGEPSLSLYAADAAEEHPSTHPQELQT
jgi:hypothetical protein